MKTSRILRTVVVYFQSENESPGNPGWAWRANYSDGHQESGPIDINHPDYKGTEGDEPLSVVLSALDDEQYPIPADVSTLTWRAYPVGGGWCADVRESQLHTAEACS